MEVSSDELHKEIESLRAQWTSERNLRITLQEQCDLLAEDNIRLQKIVDKQSYSKYFTDDSDQLSLPPSIPAAATAVAKHDQMCMDNILIEGDGSNACIEDVTIDNACDGANVLSVIYLDRYEAICCGGANNNLNVYKASSLCSRDDSSKQKLYSYRSSAPILSMDANKSNMLLALMDGKHVMITLEELHLDDDSVVLQAQSIAVFCDHTKFITSIRFSKDGSFYASASNDMSVHLYKQDTNDLNAYVKVTTLRYTGIPESIAMSSKELIIAVRGRDHLIYLDCNTLEQKQVSLNLVSWDTHVSLVPLFISLSPDCNYLAVATDKNIILVFQTGSSRRLRTLAGHNCGDYGKPKLAWSRCGKYIYTNSDEEYYIYVYDVASEKTVHVLNKHKNVVRDIFYHSSRDMMLTASFDRTVVMWGSNRG